MGKMNEIRDRGDGTYETNEGVYDTAASTQIGEALGTIGGGQYSLGTIGNNDPHLYLNPSATRKDQSEGERIQEQRQDFYYGGSPTGAQDAITAARTNMDPYTSTLGSYGQSYFDQGAGAAGRTAPIDQQNLGLHGQGVGGVYDAAGNLANLAMQGPGPSQAQAQLNASTGTAMRQQLALAGSGRGPGGGAAAFRQAADNQAMIQGQANAQSAVIRAQEEAAWRDQQAKMLGMSGDLYGAGGGLALSGAQYTTGAELSQTGLNDQFAIGMGGLANSAQQSAGALQLGTEGQAHAINMGELSGGMGYENALNQIYGIDKGVQQQNAAMAQQQSAANMALLGTGLTVAGGVAGTFLAPGAGTVAGAAAGNAAGTALQEQSDIRSKEHIAPADDDVTRTLRELGTKRGEAASGAATQAEAFAGQTGIGHPIPDLRQTGSYAYDYRDPARHGAGRHYGPMAQELERTPAGASTVVNQPDGTKAVDTGRLTMLNTSALGGVQREQDTFAKDMAEADKRIAELEALLDRKGKGSTRKPVKVDYEFGPNEDEPAPKVSYAFGPNEPAAASPVAYDFGGQAKELDDLDEAYRVVGF